MGKKIALLLAAIGLVFQISACTSSDNSGDSQTAQDSESVDGANTDAASSANSENLTSDVISEDQLSADPAAPVAENASSSEMTSSTTTTETRDENTSFNSNATVENTTTANQTQTSPAANNSVTEVAPPVVPEASQAVVVPPTDAASDQASSAPKASLQKVQSTPWQVGDTWVNAVYFARPGETLSKISKKIYGSSKVSMLKKINPSLASGVRPGDKVYYNSPVRPDDSLRMLTYFEDNGVAPEMYSAAEGDNLRKVSKKLLGYDNAWKEVWSTNLVESKTSLTAGTELRYWKGDATNVTAPPPAMADMGAPSKHNDQAKHSEPTPEEMAMAANAGQVPPMPAPDMGGPNGPNAGNSAGAPPPADMPAPPPPPMDPPPPVPSMAGNELAPPPPPIDANLGSEKKEKKKKSAAAEEDMMSQDNMMAMIAVGAALAGLLALVIVRRKRKQKEAEAAFSDTHVG